MSKPFRTSCTLFLLGLILAALSVGYGSAQAAAMAPTAARGSSSAPSQPMAASGSGAASSMPQYVPDAVCKACHGTLAREFTKTMMGNVFELHPSDSLEKMGCQGCHGPGSIHVNSGGKKVGGMITFNHALDPSVKAENNRCLACHDRGERSFWRASAHAEHGLACVDCHTIMHKAAEYQLKAPAPLSTSFTTPYVVTRPETQVCLRCHLRQAMEINLPSHMPIREGLMTCTDCHNPHGGPYPHQLRAATVNQLCYSCHAEKRGPFLWEHPPVMTNCLNCHLPHGSVNQHLLKVREPLLCQRCHIGTFHPGTPGQPGSIFVFNQSCTNCHSQIHGSNSPGGRVFTR